MTGQMRTVTLEYEAYIPMALKEMRKYARTSFDNGPVRNVRFPIVSVRSELEKPVL